MKLKEYGHNACAITDHSSCAGWIEFNQAMQANDIKPIFGNEFYCRDSYDEPKTRDRDHLVMLAMNETGLTNIRRFQRIAVENFYYKPILSYECLKQYPTDGIYCTSACSLGSIAKNILDDNVDKAEDYLLFFDEIFNHNFSLELQFHPLYDEQKIINNELVILSENYGVPLTVSCDSHFVDGTDKNLRRIVQSISWHKKLSEVNDSMDSNSVGCAQNIKKYAEQSGFNDMDIVNKALEQTYVIANRCNASIDDESNKIPTFTKHNEFNKIFSTIW
jgi:DNA polymerase-3 subunit alpha